MIRRNVYQVPDLQEMIGPDNLSNNHTDASIRVEQSPFEASASPSNNSLGDILESQGSVSPDDLKDDAAEVLYHLAQDPSLEAHWDSLAVAHESLYWTRLWVVQEFLVSRRTIIHCGLRVTNCVPFTLVRRSLELCINNYGQNNVCSSTQTIVANYNLSLVYLGEDKIRGGTSSLGQNLEGYRNQRVKDPKDKVYGLLETYSSATKDFLLIMVYQSKKFSKPLLGTSSKPRETLESFVKVLNLLEVLHVEFLLY